MTARISALPALPVLPAVVQPDWPAIWSDILKDEVLFMRLLRHRKYLGHGSFGVVYEVAGAAVKIGCIDIREIELQRWAHEHFHRALPVWAYAPAVKVPKVISHNSCPIHGYAGLPANDWDCQCGAPMDVMVMPLAKPANHLWDTSKNILRPVIDDLYVRFSFVWDQSPRNILTYHGRLVMADFGNPESDSALFW